MTSAFYPPHVGGVEKFTEALAGELVRRGHELTVLTSNMEHSERTAVNMDGDARVILLPTRKLMGGRFPVYKNTSAANDIIKKLVDEQFDAVVVNARFYPISLLGFKIAERSGSKSILIEHGSGHIGFGKKLVDLVVRRYEHAMARAVKRHRPKAYGVSSEAAAWLSHFGIEASGVIHNSINAEQFSNCASDRNFRAEAGLEEGTPVAAFSGRLYREKGVYRILDLAKHFENRDSRLHFFLAGDGPEFDALSKLAPTNMKLLGHVSPEDMAGLLKQADLYIFPSFSEGLPTSVLEAAACECCIVSTAVGGVREIIPDSSFGTVLDPYDKDNAISAIEGYLTDHELMRSAASAVHERVKIEFSWEAAAKALEKAIAL